MKTTIKLALVAICYFAISFTATAQKEFRVRTAPAVQTPPIVKPVIMVDITIPKQSSALASAKGTIKIEADKVVPFGDENGNYFLYLDDVKENPEFRNYTGGLVPFQYSFGWDQVANGNWVSPNNGYKVILKKITDREYTYDIYNIPVKRRYAIRIGINLIGYKVDKGPDPKTQAMAYFQIENSYYMHKDYSSTNIAANFIANYPTPTLNTAYQLLPIVIKNAPLQPN